MTLSADQLTWAKKLEKLLATMPHGIEIIVGHGEVSVTDAGFFKQEIMGTNIDMLAHGGTLIHQSALHRFKIDGARVIPNSESI